MSFYYPWSRIPAELVPAVVREFLDHGVRKFVFTDSQASRCLDDADYLAFMRKLAEDMDVEFVAMHGLCGRDLDLDIPDPELRKTMIARHIAAMKLARSFGSKTYTVHIGAWAYCTLRIPVPKLMKLAKEAMEQLVPEAEKTGIVIAVENSFEPSNTPGCVLDIVRHFDGNPAVGVCYDTGHANMMAPADWKKPENYPDYQIHNWSETGIVTVPDAVEQLQPYIVTTHIHDNDGYRDLHGMPFDGTIDWNALMPKLRACPRMLEFQTEVCMSCGVNWAGKLLAPAGGYSIKRLVEAFRGLGF